MSIKDISDLILNADTRIMDCRCVVQGPAYCHQCLEQRRIIEGLEQLALRMKYKSDRINLL